MARPRKRVTKKEKDLERGSLTERKRGIIIGEFRSAERNGLPFVFADVARRVRVDSHVVSRVVADLRAGGDGGASCARGNLASHNVARAARVKERSTLVARIAGLRETAADGSSRATAPTLEAIRAKLPAALRPESLSTVQRDLEAEGIWRLSTVTCPLMGEQWHMDRRRYAAEVLRTYPECDHVDALIASDETLITTNNVETRKEYRRRKTKPMFVKKQPHPPQVMVWLAIGVGYKKIVIHENKTEKKNKARWKTKVAMVEGLKMRLSHIRPGLRYSKEKLLRMNVAEKKEWLKLERKWEEECGSKGVNGRVYADLCLTPMAEELEKLERVRGKKMLILEDNSPVHTSNFATVTKSLMKLKFIPHPPYSCDMNPAEFANAWLKRFVSNEAPTTEAELIRAVKKGFSKISQRTINSWIRTYWERLRECGKQKGQWVGSRECRLPKAARSEDHRPQVTQIFSRKKGNEKKTV
jgi:transposase